MNNIKNKIFKTKNNNYYTCYGFYPDVLNKEKGVVIIAPLFKDNSIMSSVDSVVFNKNFKEVTNKEINLIEI
jgi:hypothetical protein